MKVLMITKTDPAFPQEMQGQQAAWSEQYLEENFANILPPCTVMGKK